MFKDEYQGASILALIASICCILFSGFAADVNLEGLAVSLGAVAVILIFVARGMWRD